MPRDKVFLCYSHKDKRWLDQLAVHLTPLEQDGLLDLWVDSRIAPGDRWRGEIAAALASARVGVLLVSPDFLASRFITTEEVPALLRAAEQEGARLLCLYLRPSVVEQREYAWVDATGVRQALKLTDFQGLNSPDEPLSKPQGHARERKLVDAAEAILRFARAPADGTGKRIRKPDSAAVPGTNQRDADRELDGVLFLLTDGREAFNGLAFAIDEVHMLTTDDPRLHTGAPVTKGVILGVRPLAARDQEVRCEVLVNPRRGIPTLLRCMEDLPRGTRVLPRLDYPAYEGRDLRVPVPGRERGLKLASARGRSMLEDGIVRLELLAPDPEVCVGGAPMLDPAGGGVVGVLTGGYLNRPATDYQMTTWPAIAEAFPRLGVKWTTRPQPARRSASPVLRTPATVEALAAEPAPGPEPAADEIAWAHLADLRFQADGDSGHEELRRALLEDLEMFSGKRAAGRGAERLPLDFLVVTGDVTGNGKTDEYRLARDFLEKVASATGLPLARIFTVPGNHDVDRERDVPAFMRAVDGRERFEALWKNPAARRALFAEKLAAYRTFAAELNPALRIPEEQPGGFLHRVELEGRAVAILGLGSSWLGEGSDEDRGRLLVGRAQAYGLGGGAGLPLLEGLDLRLALLHHPLSWLQPFDREDLGKLLADHTDLVLHGHRHDGVTAEVSPGRVLRLLAAGRIGRQRAFGYRVCRVRFGAARELTVWLRKYVPAERCFVKDVETYAADAAADDGKLSFALRARVAATVERKAVARAAPAADPTRYLGWLCEQTGWFAFPRLRAKVPETRAELTSVYTRLRVRLPLAEESPREATGRAKGKERPEGTGDERGQDLARALKDHPHLALVGDPGSGKTTFLNYVALNLSRALLGADRDEAMARLELTGEPPFPVLVRLGDFSQFLRDCPQLSYPPDAPEHFYRFLDYRLRGYDFGLPETYLRDRVCSGNCMVLLDGLDEVPGEDVRRQVSAIVRNAIEVGKHRGNRHVVTCGTRAYRDEIWRHSCFTLAELADFGRAEVEEFVGLWSRALHRVPGGESGTALADKAEAYRRELLAAIRAHPSIAALTARPLMLTVLGVVHWSRRKLPEQRAELYEAALESLLESRTTLSPHPAPIRKECLQAVAWRMFVAGTVVRKTIGRGEAAEAVKDLLYDDIHRALNFVEDEVLNGGILVSRGEGEVEFWHATFADYLVALALSSREDWWERIRAYLFEEHWGDVVLLLAGCRRRLGVSFASDYITRVLQSESGLPGTARAVGLTGRILRDVLPYGGEPAAGTRYPEALQATLAVFEKGQVTAIPEAVRVEVGEALGQNGDPRLADGEKNWVLVRGGSFWMGAQSDKPREPGYDSEAEGREGPVHRVTLSDFRIGRYPVTVDEYRSFVDAGEEGYLDRTLWPEEGWTWHAGAKVESAEEWEGQVRHPNRPVVGVSWYEAVAYCAWLTRRSGRRVTLPTEAQWEFAARGEESRTYPWGKQGPTDQHANFESRVGHPTPVGIYPLGVTPEGVHDLAGNIWEWCSDRAAAYEEGEARDPAGPPRGRTRQLRGGGFVANRRGVRGSFRVDLPPRLRSAGVGFRCVVELAGGQSG